MKTFINQVTLGAAASQMGSQAPWLSEEGKCCDVSYVTGVVAFMFVYKLIHQPFDDRLSSHEKLSFKSTNIICVIQGTSQTESKIIFLSPVTSVHIFFVLRSHGVHQKG